MEVAEHIELTFQCVGRNESHVRLPHDCCQMSSVPIPQPGAPALLSFDRPDVRDHRFTVNTAAWFGNQVSWYPLRRVPRIIHTLLPHRKGSLTVRCLKHQPFSACRGVNGRRLETAI
jgi:hypothetical protein